MSDGPRSPNRACLSALIPLLMGLLAAGAFERQARAGSPSGMEPPAWRAGTNSVLLITKAKPLFLDTPVTVNGEAAAAIIAPGCYSAVAVALQDQIRGLTGVKIPIVADTELADAQGRWNAKGLAHRNKSLILVGDLETNRLLPLLYARLYTAVDAEYPGSGGYALHTIHDPWGNGHNVVVVGGSDPAGVRLATEALRVALAKLPPGATLCFPRLLKLKLGPDAALVRISNPDEARIGRTVKGAREAFQRGQHTGITRDLCRAGSNYAQTGLDGFAELFKRLARLMMEIRRTNPTTYGGPWGMDADFNSMQVIAFWDIVEESPVFTEAERLEVTRILAEYASYVGGYGNSRDALRPGIRHNHNTHPCLGLLFAAEYFGKYYHAAEAAEWLALADACFRQQALSYKPQEDANGYQWLTVDHMLRYALARPDHTYLVNGNARRVLDLAIGTMDNLGYQAPFGDVGSFRGWENETRLWSIGAWYLGEPAYRWAIDKEASQGRRPRGNVASYATLKPAGQEPGAGFKGVKVFPMERRFYDHWAPKAQVEKLWVAPFEQTYEKVSFRDSFDPQAPYLLLDGIGTGGHRHYDGNALIRYSDRGREWFADGDYIQALPKFHTSVLVFCDGRSSTLPPFCALEAHADLPGAGMLRSTVREYGGADWSRNLVWLRNGAVVAIDSLKAAKAGDYSFRAVWHTLGQPQIEGSRFDLEQQGERLTLDNLDGSRLKLVENAQLGQNWRAYTNAQPIVRVLQHIAARKLEAGESYHFLNVFSTARAGSSHPVNATRVSASSLNVTAHGEATLVGVTEGRPLMVAPGVETDAAVFALRAGRASLARATLLVVEGRTLLRAGRPVDAELDWTTGLATVQSTEPTALALGGREVSVAPGRQEIQIAGAPQLARLRLPSGPSVAAPVAAAGAEAPALPVRWTFRGSFTCMASGDLDGDKRAETVVGAADGRVQCIDGMGKERWAFKLPHAVTSLWAGPLGVVAGSVDGDVFLLNADGKKVWAHRFSYYKREPIVSVIFPSELDGPGKPAIICGTEAWRFHALDRRGKQLWQYEGVHASTCGAAADLDGDGKQEVLGGTEYYSWHAIAPDGKRRWTYRATAGPHANCVAAADVNNDGRVEVVFGGADGNLHALNAMGKSLWKFNTGDEVTGVAIAAGRLFASSRSFNLYALDGKGRLLWRRDCGDELNGLTLSRRGNETLVATAGDDGRVALHSADGLLLQEAKLPGAVVRVAVADLDGDGRQALVALTARHGVVTLETSPAR